MIVLSQEDFAMWSLKANKHFTSNIFKKGVPLLDKHVSICCDDITFHVLVG